MIKIFQIIYCEDYTDKYIIGTFFNKDKAIEKMEKERKANPGYGRNSWEIVSYNIEDSENEK